MNLVLGASTSNGVDSVSASFVPAGQADYTVNIVNGSLTLTAIELLRGPVYGYSPLFGSSVFVNFSTINQNFGLFSDPVIGQVAGTDAVHELTHKIAGVGDSPYTGGQPNLMQTGAYGAAAANAVVANAPYLDPYGLLLASDQYSALYGACQQRQDLNHLGGGSGGGEADSWVFFQPVIWGGEGASFGTGGWIWWPTPTPKPPSNQ
jgi:hypothetical protein